MDISKKELDAITYFARGIICGAEFVARATDGYSRLEEEWIDWSPNYVINFWYEDDDLLAAVYPQTQGCIDTQTFQRLDLSGPWA